MIYILLIFLVGMAIYYFFKWQTPGNSNNSQNNTRPNNGNTYNEDAGPYSASGNAYRQQTSSNGKNSYAKWVGGGLGWAFGGPIGGIMGFVLGSMFQGGGKTAYRQGIPTQSGDFNVSLLVLTAAVMKADGKVTKSELDYVKHFFVANFGKEAAQRDIQILKKILEQKYSVEEVSRQIGQYMDYSSRLQLLHYLFGIAQADGAVSQPEIDIIDSISAAMGLGNADFQSIKAMFVKDTDNAYVILGIQKSASDEEVKMAYREMAKKYHPDKVAHLGEEVKKAAEEKFRNVNDAYDLIKKERGIK